MQETLQQALGRYQAAVAGGQRLLEDRLRFRQQTAAQIQNYRYKDMAFRIFRNDALQKYRAQFDLAAMYVYRAARAYDYETCLKKGDPRGPGSYFMTGIIRSRSLGLIQNGLPETGSASGDPGLADPMARMNLDWSLVLKGQLGFNNPQTETGRFSLRSELFRIQPGSTGSKVWRDTLTRNVVPNLLVIPEFKRFCVPFQPALPIEPAIVIPFSTSINFGQNFFGWPAGGGDNSYDSTHFVTKIRSVGVWFANYNNLALVNTPRVYLLPRWLGHSFVIWTSSFVIPSCLALLQLFLPAACLAADKSGVSPGAISLPKGPGSIEGLGESFQPSLNTGTAKYGIGLKLPPGVAGHAPGLSLSYEGGGGNGPLGYGWSLPTAFVQRRSDHGIPTYGEDIGFPRQDTFINEMREELVPQSNGFYFCKNEGAFIRYRPVAGHWEGTLTGLGWSLD